MTEQQLDNQGEAHEALNSVVADFGQRVLSDPRMLESRMSDLIPDLERERGLMVTAARSDVAGELTRRVQEQRLDPDTAVQLVSRSLIDRTSIDAASSMWVTTEYAQALGYRVRSDVPPSPRPVPPAPPSSQETVTTYGQYGSPYRGTAPQQDPTVGAPGGYSPPQGSAGGGGYSQPPPAAGGGYYPPPQAPAGGQVTPGGPSQGPPPWESPARPPKKRNRGLIYGLGGAAAAIVIIIVVVVAATSSGPTPKPTPTPTLHPTTHPATPTAKPTVASLTELLPQDVDDPSSQCTAYTPPFTPVGLVQGLRCHDPGLSNGLIFAYQVGSAADYQATWVNFNKWWGFSGGTPGSTCPLTGSNTQAEGTTTWRDNFFPTQQGQVLECEWVGSGSTLNEPAYTYTYPTENAFIVAQGAPDSTFAALNTWWTNNAAPLNSPTPVPLASPS